MWFVVFFFLLLLLKMLASVLASFSFPLLKDQLSRHGVLNSHPCNREQPWAECRAASHRFWGLTERFEHCRLLSEGRLRPVYHVSKFCKHLRLKIKMSQGHTPWCSKYNGGLTPERMTSPDSAIAPSLLSTYTTASFISTSSSSRQSGLQAPTAAQQEKESTN